MTVTDIYKQYFGGSCMANEVQRRAAAVSVTSVYDEGVISYELLVTFFPHEDEEDYRITCDCAISRTLFSGKGRRSRKREQLILETMREEADILASEIDGEIYWDRPLTEDFAST